MAGSVRGGEAGTARAVIDEKTDLLWYDEVLAGSVSHHDLFDDLAADHVADGGGEQDAQYPPPALASEIHGHEEQEEEVEGYPEEGFPHVGQYSVEERAPPVLVNMGDKPGIYRLNKVPECQQTIGRMVDHSYKNN